MRFLTAVTTYQRVDYLKHYLETWDATRGKGHQWTLIVADDGSTDGTLDYLAGASFDGVDLRVIPCQRRGVHHLTNQLLRASLDTDFDFGFKTDDDLFYLSPGWDDAYYSAAMATGYHHLAFFDPSWGRASYGNIHVVHPSGLLESKVRYYQVQGAFWTFTRQVIEKVGFFDLQNFGLCHMGHVDYTVRCALAGFNDKNRIFDVCGSLKYLKLVTEKYRGAIARRQRMGVMNSKEVVDKKLHLVTARDRGYVSYNESDLDMLLRKVEK